MNFEPLVPIPRSDSSEFTCAHCGVEIQADGGRPRPLVCPHCGMALQEPPLRANGPAQPFQPEVAELDRLPQGPTEYGLLEEGS